VHVVTDVCAKRWPVGPFPKLDACDSEQDESKNEHAPGKQHSLGGGVLGAEDLFESIGFSHQHLLEGIGFESETFARRQG
jgi:hypothetical protein